MERTNIASIIMAKSEHQKFIHKRVTLPALIVYFWHFVEKLMIFGETYVEI
jgi:hypothetical protein